MSAFDEGLDDPDEDDAPDASDPRVVLYVDGGMEPAAQRAFETELEGSAALRQEVDTARIVRRLVSGLPRAKSTLPTVDVLFERLDAEPTQELGRLLRAIPREQAPAALRDRVLRKIPALTPERLRAITPRTWLRMAAAAIVLVSCGLAFDAGRSPPPRKGPFRLEFERAPQRILPGSEASAMPRFPASVGVVDDRGDRR
ncbi:MAG: hypothetical protein IPH13_14875 [Planctomycetes bacterium]|nr:hypothetical protein [Planctomycetota bacterium]MCC7170974.1 hypothetical protein [Planctomycetota bacterium]